ncbi:MAG: radical SAM protein [Kiritimatiellae bacterium]|nr:radical SAM protein [Kiritimatiellia bacterium]
MKPYRLFSCRGVKFAYHLGLGKFLTLAPDAWEMLALRRTRPRAAAEAAFRRARRRSAKTVLADMRRLEADGFFEPASKALCDDATFEKALLARENAPTTTLELSLSEKCNLACRYCYCGTCRGELPRGGLMSGGTAARAVEWLFAGSGENDVNVTFFGGEPLLNKRVLKSTVALCEKRAKERGVKVTFSMTTNGTLVDDETADFIAAHGFSLMVSLDGPREIHDAQCPTRGGRGSWRAAVAGAQRLMARCPSLSVRCTMSHPAPDMMKLVRFFDGLGFSRIVMGPAVNPQFPSRCDFLEEDRLSVAGQMADEIVPWMLAEIAAGREPKFDPFADLEATQLSGVPSPPYAMKCGACHGTVTVGADGRMYPCHRFAGQKARVLGTLESGPSPEARRAFWRGYRECIKKTCSGCWAYRLCGGPCPWEISRIDGSFKADPAICRDVKRCLKLGAWYLDLKRRMKTQQKKEQNANTEKIRCKTAGDHRRRCFMHDALGRAE